MKTKMKTSELAGDALDYCVAISDGGKPHASASIVILGGYSPSTDWGISGEIIERENISIIRCDDHFKKENGFTTSKRIPVWAAEHGGRHSIQTCYEGQHYDPQYEIAEADCSYGPTPLIAAMRCFVAHKLGNEVEVSTELLGQDLQNKSISKPRAPLEFVTSGMHFGKILKIKDGVATQKVGLTDDVVVHHVVSNLKGDIKEGANVDIHYSSGIGQVYTKERGVER